MSTHMPSVVKQDLQSAQLILISLKRDHEQALENLNAFHTNATEEVKLFNSEKIPLIQSALSRIQDGLDESESLLTVAKYVDCLEAELMKLRLHNQRLGEETCWLREELKHTQNKLIKSEALLIQAVNEKQHSDFLSEINKFDGMDEKKDFVNHGCVPSIKQVMSASMTVPPITPKHSVSSNSSFIRHLQDVPSMAFSQQTLDASGLLNSSMVDTDLNLWSCTQSFHPSLLASHTEHRLTNSGLKPASVPPSLRTLHRIVLQYTGQGKHEMAAALCAKAISDLERSGGRNQADVAVMLNILALVYRDQGKYNEAADLLQSVVSIRERLFGSNNALVAASLNNLAVLYAKAERHSEAEPLCRRALAIREKLLGPNHLDVAKQLNNLALLCQSQGRFEEVESCLRRALDIYSKLYKPSSPIVLRAKNNLASILLKRGNLMDAEALLKALLSPDQSSFAPPPSVVNGLSSSKVIAFTEADSAVFSVEGSCNDLPNGGPDESDSESPQCPVPPLWSLVERVGKGDRDQLARLAKLDLSSWVSEAHMDISIVQSAVRNLAIIYQRQGHALQANLLRLWIQPKASHNKNPTSNATHEVPRSTRLPCPSLHSNLSDPQPARSSDTPFSFSPRPTSTPFSD